MKKIKISLTNVSVFELPRRFNIKFPPHLIFRAYPIAPIHLMLSPFIRLVKLVERSRRRFEGPVRTWTLGEFAKTLTRNLRRQSKKQELTAGLTIVRTGQLK